MKQDRHFKIEVKEGVGPSKHILTKAECGSWVVSLPPLLLANQDELKKMLVSMFADKKSSGENLALAQQLSLNWCASKAFKQGLSLEECWRQNLP
jgi:hypothetical protein